MEPNIIIRWVHHHYHGSSYSFPVFLIKKFNFNFNFFIFKITLATCSSFLLFCLPSYTIIHLNCQLPSYGSSDFFVPRFIF